MLKIKNYIKMTNGTIPTSGKITVDSKDLRQLFMVQFKIKKEHEIKASIRDKNTTKILTIIVEEANFQKTKPKDEESTKNTSETENSDSFSGVLKAFKAVIKGIEELKGSYWVFKGHIKGTKKHPITILYYLEKEEAQYKVSVVN